MQPSEPAVYAAPTCPHCGESAHAHAVGPCMDAWVGRAVLGKAVVLLGPHWFFALPPGSATNIAVITADGTKFVAVPAFSTEMNAAYAMENYIAGRNLQGEYSKSLIRLVGTNGFDSARNGTNKISIHPWQMIHASAEERCRAALMMGGGV